MDISDSRAAGALSNYEGIWVYVELTDGRIAKSTFELLAKSEELKKKSGGNDTITAVILGDGASKYADELFSYGAERVIAAENANLASYSARPYAKVLTQLCEKHKPSILLFSATAEGRDVAPRVMCALKTGMTADAIDLDIDDEGTFVQTKPSFGGNVLSHIAIPNRRPQMATVRPGVFSAKEPVSGAKGELIVESVSVEADPDYVVLESSPVKHDGKPIDECDVLVVGGRGVKSAEELAMLRELAEALGGEVACSRPLVDVAMMPHDKQIGQSGTTVKPKFIINVGISGSVQYTVGMDKAAKVLSINHTKGTPIFGLSHYGAVIDFKKLVPALTEEIKKRKK